MTTITLASITNQMASVITSLTPSTLTINNAGFAENAAPNAPLRSWARFGPREKRIRLFDLLTVGDRTALGLLHPEATLAQQTIRVTVAYPTEHKEFYGITTRRGFEDLIAADALQIQNALMLGTSLAGAGHLALRLAPGIKELDRGDAVVWFQDIDVAALYYAAR